MLVRPEHVASVRMVIGAAEKFPRIGQVFYEAGPRQGIARLASYLARQTAAGRLSISDPELAAQQFLELCSGAVLKRLMFRVSEAPDTAAIERHVDGVMHLFLAAYAAKPRQNGQNETL
jgi:hypothetical protein